MKKLAVFLLGLAVAAGFALPEAQAAKTWNLRFTSSYMDTHPTVINGFLPWFEQIKKDTNNQVRVRNFNPNTICPEGEIYASTVKGIIDMGGANHARVAGKFPLHEVFILPLIANSSESTAETAWTIYREFPSIQKEMEETMVLGYWASAPYQLHTVNKQVKKLEDIKGMRIIAWSKPCADMLVAFGANPIIIAPPETYLALSRNQADGVLCPLAPFRSFKVNEVTKYTTFGNFAADSFYMSINKKLWNSFPENVRAAFLANTDNEWCNRIGRTLDVGAAGDEKILTAAGHTFYTLPPEELARWTKAIAPMDEAWVKKVVDLKVISEADARALLKRTRAVGAEVTRKLSAK